MSDELLKWSKASWGASFAQLGTPQDGVLFTLSVHPTCYSRRGQFRLLVEVCGGVNHHKWGCFDEVDQPMRYYHDLQVAKDEAERIAKVLKADRERVNA